VVAKEIDLDPMARAVSMIKIREKKKHGQQSVRVQGAL